MVARLSIKSLLYIQQTEGYVDRKLYLTWRRDEPSRGGVISIVCASAALLLLFSKRADETVAFTTKV